MKSNELIAITSMGYLLFLFLFLIGEYGAMGEINLSSSEDIDFSFLEEIYLNRPALVATFGIYVSAILSISFLITAFLGRAIFGYFSFFKNNPLPRVSKKKSSDLNQVFVISLFALFFMIILTLFFDLSKYFSGTNFLFKLSFLSPLIFSTFFTLSLKSGIDKFLKSTLICLLPWFLLFIFSIFFGEIYSGYGYFFSFILLSIEFLFYIKNYLNIHFSTFNRFNFIYFLNLFSKKSLLNYKISPKPISRQ